MTGTPLDPWAPLARLTSARIALGRAGGSLPTRAHLEFQLAHAQARDAVQHPADLARVAEQLAAAGLVAVQVASAAPDLTSYLRRPDLGRRLAEEYVALVAALARPAGYDLAIVIADGLSGLAVEAHAAPLAALVATRVGEAGWSLAPVVIVAQGRVAIGDEIAARLGARMLLLLVGERPGLSSPDSLGAYLTWNPAPGRTDAERNCVSNIRPEGLPLRVAVDRISWLLLEGRRRELTGVALKEEMDGGLLR